MAAIGRKVFDKISYHLKNGHNVKFVRNVSNPGTFKYSDLEITTTTNPQEKPTPEKLLFGHHFTDHMLHVEWSINKGWGKPHIGPLQNISLHPAAKVLHYGAELFEGMKAYKGIDEKIRLFRPMENMKRMNKTAERCALPTFDGTELVKCIKKLLSVDADWVPTTQNSSLYIRPTLIGNDPTLGVSLSHNAMLFVILGPVGSYFTTGLDPITLFADPKYVRAWPGGCGSYKMGSNYAPTVQVQAKAVEANCHQVLWLFGDDHQLTEVGTMNIFMYWTNEQGEDELITHPLDGLVLPGITRSSLIKVAEKWGEFKVTEKPYTMKQVIKALKENRIKEIFGAGTACVVCPVKEILYKGELLNIPAVGEPKLSMRFYDELTDIQLGKKESEWTELI
ncbi:branched-chain-amino-acid aminotransferase, cytosolic [Patella vulgata]|uniref:branched-chain-amino-acid aminotransferase, cytosolic n=1 Tax=Patella vulgata TaxID=6465 RepID=UPI00217F5CC4|nr:branched-chain-amino-acid aminotransferase, cytosolic [Patella vulgata]